MKFVKSNIVILIAIILAYLAEYLHVLFEGIPHSDYVTPVGGIRVIYYDDMIYYFTNEFFVLYLLIVLLVNCKTNTSKSLTAILVVWYAIEFIEVTLQLFKISNARLIVNDGSWIQIFTSFFLGGLSYFGFSKYKS